jgi:hypothetical protein
MSWPKGNGVDSERQKDTRHASKNSSGAPSAIKRRPSTLSHAMKYWTRLFFPIGVHFYKDFGFYNSPSICRFVCFLLLTFAVTGYKWVFYQQSKHPLINLLLWLIWQLID